MNIRQTNILFLQYRHINLTGECITYNQLQIQVYFGQTRHCWPQTNKSAQCRPLLVQRTDRQADGGADRINRQPHRWISAAAYRAVGRDRRCTGHGHTRGPTPKTSSQPRPDPHSLAEGGKKEHLFVVRENDEPQLSSTCELQ